MFLLLRKEYYFESSTQRLFQDFGSALHRKASNYDAKPLPSLQLQAADRHHLPSANNVRSPNRYSTRPLLTPSFDMALPTHATGVATLARCFIIHRVSGFDNIYYPRAVEYCRPLTILCHFNAGLRLTASFEFEPELSSGFHSSSQPRRRCYWSYCRPFRSPSYYTSLGDLSASLSVGSSSRPAVFVPTNARYR